MQRLARFAAPLAALAFFASIAGFGAAFEAYSHLQHPVGLLGASLVPRAGAFNVCAFLLPGALAAWVAVTSRSRLADAGWLARIGTQALLLSTIAYATQGLLPLDSLDLDGGASRLHAAAWTMWWIAFAVACSLLAMGLRHRRRASAFGLAACSGMVLAFALVAPAFMHAGLAQRLAFAAWFIALAWIERLSRNAA